MVPCDTLSLLGGVFGESISVALGPGVPADIIGDVDVKTPPPPPPPPPAPSSPDPTAAAAADAEFSKESVAVEELFNIVPNAVAVLVFDIR